MMMVEDADCLAESFYSALRIALTVAGQMGEKLARLRKEHARRRDADAVQEARELTARLDAERGAMRASLGPVSSPKWWDAATPDMIAGVHETATLMTRVPLRERSPGFCARRTPTGREPARNDGDRGRSLPRRSCLSGMRNATTATTASGPGRVRGRV